MSNQRHNLYKLGCTHKNVRFVHRYFIQGSKCVQEFCGALKNFILLRKGGEIY